MKHSLWDALPRWLLTWLVCFALALGLGDLLRVNGRWWLAALVLLLWCAVLALAERLGRFWAMLAVWTVGFGLCLLLSDGKRLSDALPALLSRTGAAKGYGELVLLLLCSTLALPLSALLRFFRARAALSIGWTALWITAALMEWHIPRLVPAALIPLLLLTLAEAIRRIRRESEPEESLKRALLLALLPAALLLALLPSSSEPYDYPLLRAAAEAVERLWRDAGTALHYRHRGDTEFAMNFNGFSDAAELGEGAEEEERSIIYIKPGREPDGAVYLFGNAWDRFDGRSWVSALEAEDTEYLNWSLDTAEHLYALWRLLGADGTAEFSDFFRTNSLYLNCRNLNVRTMFSPMDTNHMFTDEKRFPYADAPTGSLFDYVQREEVWYRVYFLEANVRTRDALIAASEGKSYDARARGPLWRRVAQDFEPYFRLDLREDVNLEKTFAQREALIRSVYLDSSAVSARARALAEEITAGCGSDAEKVAAIAAYLQENYSYTLYPRPVPEDEEFLDWLLFEAREGYCTWYATAAALLSRSVGVPARYVQGYRGELAGDGYTALVSGSAHAWCECYIGGYGWVTVEATPGFEGGGKGWLTAAEERALNGGEDRAPVPAEGLSQSGASELDGYLPDLPAPADPDGADQAPVPEPESEPARSGWLPILMFLVPAAALSGAWLWARARRKRRYAAADGAEKLLLDLKRLLRDLRGKGYPRRPEESLGQYFARLPWHYLLAREEEAEEMAALYDRTFFGQTEPSEEELARHRAFAARFRPRTLRQWMIWIGLQG